MLEGLGQPEREAHNRRQARPRDRVSDPFPPIIGALNSYLHAYHMYRAEALRETEIRRLDTLSRNALENLQRVFPYGVRYANGTFRSWFCTEKPHSMTHWADNYAAVGRTRIISTSPTAMELQRHLDESGVHQVYTIYVEGILGFAPSLPKFAF